MTVISGNIEDIGYQPLSGTLTATSVDFRSENGVLVAPETHSWPINAGNVSATLLPGPARLTITVGTHARDTWDVIVPDTDVTLATLIDDSIEWAPPIVSIVGEHRRAAEAAAARAEQAATDADGSAVAAAGSAAAASSSASDAASSAASASSSAGAASGSAGDAAGSASAAAGSASAAAGSASTASQGAQVITDNLVAIEAAPGHASAAQTARTGAETARDAAAGSASTASSRATAASGSASAAAGSASDAAGSASAANSSAGTAAAQAGVASTAAGTATTRAGEAAGSATAAAGSAAAAALSADDAELWATSFGLTATSTAGAPGTSASVTVTGSGPEYGLAFTVPRGDKGPKGDDGEVSQAALDAAVASLVDNAPEALNTLSELATSLGNDPNFATTVSTEIGKRALIDGAPAAYNTLGKLVAALVAGDLGGSTDASVLTGALTGQVDVGGATLDVMDPVTGVESPWPLSDAVFYGVAAMVALGNLSDALDGKADIGHSHTKADVGLGNVDNTSDANKPVSTATQAALTPLQSRVGAAPATWRWNGTTLPTTAAQVHAQARVGDFIVCPNLTADPGWHQITGV